LTRTDRLDESGLMVEERDGPGQAGDRKPWIRLAGTGVELAAAVGGFAILGLWWDKHKGTSPWGLLTGTLLGLIGGLYNLVKSSLAASKEARADDAEARGKEHRP
jgi:F0F1-type ATP synthase assembly protein I